MISITTTQLCYCNMKTVIHNVQKNGPGGIPTNLYLHEQKVDHICPWAIVCKHMTYTE